MGGCGGLRQLRIQDFLNGGGTPTPDFGAKEQGNQWRIQDLPDEVGVVNI